MDIASYFKRNIHIESERILLRKINVSDTCDVFDYASNPLTSKYLLWSPHISYQHSLNVVRRMEEEYSNGNYYDLGVVYKENGKLIGTAGITKYDQNNACAEVGYVLNPDYWGRGIATEALKLLLNFAFCELHANRCEAKYMEGNENSRKVMEKCGLTYEGTSYGRLFVKGNFVNIGTCAILANKYFLEDHENIYRMQNKNSIFDRIINRKK